MRPPLPSLPARTCAPLAPAASQARIATRALRPARMRWRAARRSVRSANRVRAQLGAGRQHEPPGAHEQPRCLSPESPRLPSAPAGSPQARIIPASGPLRAPPFKRTPWRDRTSEAGAPFYAPAAAGAPFYAPATAGALFASKHPPQQEPCRYGGSELLPQGRCGRHFPKLFSSLSTCCTISFMDSISCWKAECTALSIALGSQSSTLQHARRAGQAGQRRFGDLV